MTVIFFSIMEYMPTVVSPLPLPKPKKNKYPSQSIQSIFKHEKKTYARPKDGQAKYQRKLMNKATSAHKNNPFHIVPTFRPKSKKKEKIAWKEKNTHFPTINSIHRCPLQKKRFSSSFIILNHISCPSPPLPKGIDTKQHFQSPHPRLPKL